MHQVHAYSATTNLRIAQPLLTEHFYPLGIDEPYIVIVTGTGAMGNRYAHWNIVINALRPIIIKAGYKIVQVGGKDDERVAADVDVCGRTSTYQYFHILKNAELVLSSDTSAAHAAGHYDRNLVTLFGVSDPKVSGPFFGNKDRQRLLIPPGEWRPNFFPGENPCSVDNIKPEIIVGAACELLNISIPKLFSTVHIGRDYRSGILTSIPNAIVPAELWRNVPLVVRFDKGGQEDIVYQQLQLRKCTIVTKQALKLEILHQLRAHLDGVSFQIEKDTEPTFVETLHRNALPYKIFTLLEGEELNEKKLDYIDFNLLEKHEPSTKEKVKLNDVVSSKTRFSTNRKLLSNGKAYLSFSHMQHEKPLDNFAQNEDTIIDEPAFWEDSDGYHIFNQ